MEEWRASILPRDAWSPLIRYLRETDLDNVLQIPAVFLSVSKGQTAPSQDLAKSFGPKTPLNDVILEILSKGELQVGERERHAQLDRVHHEVLDIVAGYLVEPKSKLVYTPGMIEKALAELSAQGSQPQQDSSGQSAGEGKAKAKETHTWTGVVTTRSAKSQALDAMKALIAHQPIPVSRARMRLRITCPTGILKHAAKAAPRATAADGADGAAEELTKGTVKDRIMSYIEQVQHQEVMGEEWEVTGFVEPGAFKGLGEFVGSETKGRGRVEVLDMAVVHEGD